MTFESSHYNHTLNMSIKSIKGLFIIKTNTTSSTLIIIIIVIIIIIIIATNFLCVHLAIWLAKSEVLLKRCNYTATTISKHH